MAPPTNPTYMDHLPDEIKLQILHNLGDNKQLMLCRLVCKDFLPKEVGIVITLFGNTGVTVKLNLAPGVDTFSSEELDGLAIFSESSTIVEKQVTNLSSVPVSLLQKTTVLITLFSEMQPNLITDLDLILEHCTIIRLFFIVLMNSQLKLDDRMEQIFEKNSSHFSHLAVFPVASVQEEENSLSFDCGSLQQCTKLSNCFIIGNENGGQNTQAEVKNFDKLPCSVRGVGFFKVGVKELEWAAENLTSLRSIYLEVVEDLTIGKPHHFNQQVFERLCNMPHLTEMELLFTVEDDRLGPLKEILGEILARCEVTAGVQAYFVEFPGGFNEEGVLEHAKLAILVNVTRPPFGGFKDGDDENEEMIDDNFDDLD